MDKVASEDNMMSFLYIFFCIILSASFQLSVRTFVFDALLPYPMIDEARPVDHK